MAGAASLPRYVPFDVDESVLELRPGADRPLPGLERPRRRGRLRADLEHLPAAAGACWRSSAAPWATSNPDERTASWPDCEHVPGDLFLLGIDLKGRVIWRGRTTTARAHGGVQPQRARGRQHGGSARLPPGGVRARGVLRRGEPGSRCGCGQRRPARPHRGGEPRSRPSPTARRSAPRSARSSRARRSRTSWRRQDHLDRFFTDDGELSGSQSHLRRCAESVAGLPTATESVLIPRGSWVDTDAGGAALERARPDEQALSTRTCSPISGSGGSNRCADRRCAGARHVPRRQRPDRVHMESRRRGL